MLSCTFSMFWTTVTSQTSSEKSGRTDIQSNRLLCLAQQRDSQKGRTRFRVFTWQAQRFVNLHVQISWQAQHCVNLHVQISGQAQHCVNLHAQNSWQAQHCVNLDAQISWQAQALCEPRGADFAP